MEKEQPPEAAAEGLSDDDMALVRERFESEVVPKLRKLHARLGTLSCEFAGERFRNWVVRFRSVGSGFDITEFAYDEDASAMDLDL